MAQTVVDKSVHGDRRVVVIDVNLGAASTSVACPGIKNIKSWNVGPQSMATTAVKMAASGSNVVVSNGASGDQFYLTVYGT